MSYKTGDRNQRTFLPACIEDYINTDDPVRAYDIFVESLDFSKLGIIIEECKAGAHPYHPKAMLKLLVYGYAYGIRSSRKLERAGKHNLSFIWLTGNLQPDYRTIARFRRDNTEALKQVLKQCVHMCVSLDLIEGNTLFIDGSKIKANASLKNTMTKEEYKEYLEKVTKNIENILSECETTDMAEANDKSLVQLAKELRNQKDLASRIKDVLEEFENTERNKLNLTDKDSIKNKGDRGVKMYYNAQIAVDEKNGLIVNTDIVSEASDNKQFNNQLKQAEEVLEKPVSVACADAGYFSTKELEKVSPGTQVIVPSQRQAQKENGTKKPFSKSEFTYDREKDEYICPEGARLRLVSPKPTDDGFYNYRAHQQDCRNCKHFGVCTSSTHGRNLFIFVDEAVKEQFEKIYASPEGQKIYKLRKEKVELPFGHIKHNLGAREFLLRSTQGAKAEISLLASCFNITRMISISGGVTKLLTKLRTA